MIVATDRDALDRALADARTERRRIGFVPTMGNLHAGHLSLAKQLRQQADVVVASIFVNPTQFAPGEDFERYPRTFEHDRQLLEQVGVDVLYAPSIPELYPFGTDAAVRVHVPGLSDELCGAHRPGHFDGVATVVVRLFLAVRPELAIFGRKDYQQVLVIERMTEDLGFGIRIVKGETVREPDGLAMSSRNGYLSAADRERAAAVHEALQAVRRAIEAGAELPDAIGTGTALLRARTIDVEYLQVRRAADLAPATNEDRELVALTAVRVGTTRLIDNLEVRAPA